MIDFNIIKPISVRPWQGEYDPDKPSIAIIAYFDDEYLLLDWVGYDMEFEVSKMGFKHPSDLGLEPKENGIWKWSGRWEYFQGSYEYPEDGESLPIGQFERLTPEEAYRLSLGECIIDKDFYKKPQENQNNSDDSI